MIDWSTNFVSLGFLAISGLLINSLIAKHYGSSALGLFNLVFAVYILGSQIATFGVQYSVIRYVSEIGRTAVAGRLLLSALVVAGSVSSIVVAITALLFLTTGSTIYGDAVTSGIMVMLPGLWCFSINKVILNALNGLQYNGLFAVFTSLRYFLMSISMIAVVWMNVEDFYLCAVLPVSEGLLLATLVICFTRHFFSQYDVRLDGDWLKRHVQFGSRSLLGGVAVELNTRVDILVLGLFTSEAQVGIYSFAAFFVEGILQLPQISRRLVDPSIAKLASERRLDELRDFTRKGRNIGAIAALTTTVIAIALYPYGAAFLSDPTMASTSWPIFSILMLGATVFAVYGAFSGLLSQAGFPVAQTQYNLMVLGTNALLNFALAPRFGINGAAVATAMSFAIGTIYFRAQVFRHLKIQI